jgi:hypothetical protein
VNSGGIQPASQGDPFEPLSQGVRFQRCRVGETARRRRGEAKPAPTAFSEILRFGSSGFWLAIRKVNLRFRRFATFCIPS